MRVSKGTLIVLVSMLFISIFLANVVSLLSTDRIQVKRDPNYLKITDTDKHLMWFLQISDIHISVFRDPYRITEFKEFCVRTVDVFNPPVVLASGDLTDAKTKENIGSEQLEKEWEYYKNILKECGIKEKTLWLDIHGNHDVFNVAGINSKQNFFTNYSIQGPRHPRSYMYQIKSGSEVYSFIGVDASQMPGPRRPFNFIGLLHEKDMNEINTMIKKVQSSNSNYTIWFGHFPTSCILTVGDEGIRDLIQKDDKALVYVCGHLHTLGGMVPNMYTLQPAGFLELELGDWKDNRMYRLLAIDHGLVSFVDVPHGKWPVVLITNPKHGLFLNPAKENFDSIKTSTHIRVLAFSLAEIAVVKVRINNEIWRDLRHVKGPLYVIEWDPEKYSGETHNIEVYAIDQQGREVRNSQPLVLRNNLKFNLLPRLLLMSDATTIFRSMFILLMLMCILPLISLRVLHRLIEQKKVAVPNFRGGYFKLWLRKLFVLACVDRIYWPVVFYPIYLLCGPWSIGYLIEDHIGVIFAWGIFVNGSFLPGSFTYTYGFIQLVIFQVPLTLLLAHGVDSTFQVKVLEIRKSACSWICLHLPFCVIFLFQISMAYPFWMAYGTMAFLLGPLRTWSVILAAVLWYHAINLPEKCTRKAAKVLKQEAPALRRALNN